MKNLRGADLNLLVIFHALMAERNVTKAGERVGLAQSSMSNALTRLRDLFEDELFVRTPEGMMPTPTATKAAEYVQAAIFSAEEALNVGRAFSPENAEGTIVLLANDFIEFTVVPWIVHALGKQAPRIRLRTHPLIGEDFIQELDTGLADLAIAAPVDIPKRFRYTVLFNEPFDGIVRRGHPILQDSVSLDAFIASKHVVVSHRFGATGVIDTVLKSLDVSLDVAVGVSNLASVPPLVAKTDFLAVVPRRLAIIADRELPVRKFELPFAVPSVEAKLIWGRGVDRSPMLTWFRELVIETFGTTEQ